MRDRDNTDVWTAVAIGAILGVGATLLVRAHQEDDAHEIIRRLRPVARQAKRTAKAARKEFGRQTRHAGETGDELLSSGREIMNELRRGARDIVRSTRKELRKAARESLREARKAARNAMR
jgi:vacuolar-type H+-ATPase subunit H